MRLSFQSRRLLWLGAAILLVAVGCASTDNGDAEPAPPATPETKQGEDANSRSKETRPAFDASFEAVDAGPKQDSGTVDMTPPGGSDQCIDKDDPGGTETTTKKLPDTDDCDNDYKTVTGTAKGAVDIDLYSLSATDKGISLDHPTGCSLDTDFVGETAGTELCVFVSCKNGTENPVTGCSGGTLSTSSIGKKGCCAAAPSSATPQWDCSGINDNDSADFFIRVKQLNGDKCLSYKFKYRF